MEYRQICSILYFDTVEASKITQGDLNSKLTSFINRIVNDIKNKSNIDIIYSNTRGDGYLIIGSNALAISDAALRIRDEYKNSDWVHLGFQYAMKVRIGLHLGVVQFSKERGKIIDAFGSALNFASRIEPITAHNHVFCTENYYLQMIAEKANKIDGDLIGEVKLPKNAGRHILYNIRRKDDPKYISEETSKSNIINAKIVNNKEYSNYGLCWEARSKRGVPQGVDCVKLPQSNDSTRMLKYKLSSNSPYWRAGIKCETNNRLPTLINSNSFLIHTGKQMNGLYGITGYLNGDKILNEEFEDIKNDRDMTFAFEQLDINRIRCQIGEHFTWEYEIESTLFKNIHLAAWGDRHDYEILFYDIFFA